MSKFWDFVRKNPITAILGLGREQADRASITPEDQAAARAMQRGQGQTMDPPPVASQGVTQMTNQHDQRPGPPASPRRRTRGRGGCQGVGQKIGLIVGAIIILVVCGTVGGLTLKVGPEVLYLAGCCVLCLVALGGLAAAYIWFQRYMAAQSGDSDH